MKSITGEWVEKAEGDFRSAQRELRVRNRPNHDLICFLSQQCAEKYLKARLVEASVLFPKTHNLTVLLRLVLTIEPTVEDLQVKLTPLNHYAVEFRYPGDVSTKEEARTAFANCRDVRKEMRKRLGLEGPPSTQMSLRIKEKRGRYKAQRKRR